MKRSQSRAKLVKAPTGVGECECGLGVPSHWELGKKQKLIKQPTALLLEQWRRATDLPKWDAHSKDTGSPS